MWLSLALAQTVAPSLGVNQIWDVLDAIEVRATKDYLKGHDLSRSERDRYSSESGLCVETADKRAVAVHVYLPEQTPPGCDPGRGFDATLRHLPGFDRLWMQQVRFGELVDAWGDPVADPGHGMLWVGPRGTVTVALRKGDHTGDRDARIARISFRPKPVRSETQRFLEEHPELANMESATHWTSGAKPELLVVMEGSPSKPAPKASPRPAPKPAPKPVAAAPKPVAAAPKAPAPWPTLSEPTRTGMKSPDDAAVVVGLETYPFLGADVPYAHRDAEAWRDLLIYTRGVPPQNVQLLTSGSREQLLAAVDRAAKEGAGGTVWVYFAGHGAASPDTGERMLLGDDVRADPAAFASRGLGVDELVARVEDAGARVQLVLDACFTGASRSGASITGGTRFVVPAYATKGSDESAQWNAAGPDQVSAPLPDREHGAFTYFAAGALRGWADGELDGERDGAVTAEEAQAYVARMLRSEGLNGQTPVWLGPTTTLVEGRLDPPPR